MVEQAVFRALSQHRSQEQKVELSNCDGFLPNHDLCLSMTDFTF
jgi:hypothetical protein